MKFKSGFNRADMQQGKNPPTTKHFFNTLKSLIIILYLPELRSHILKSPPEQLGMWYCSKGYVHIARTKTTEFYSQTKFMFRKLYIGKRNQNSRGPP